MVSDVSDVKKFRLKGMIMKYAKLMPNIKNRVENSCYNKVSGRN